MKVTILTDNNQGKHTLAEHGLSYWIEIDEKRILFDTGQTNLFITNAIILGIDVNQNDIIILSHGHFDHGNGLEFLYKGNLVCHPGCFVKRYRKIDNSYIGIINSKKEIEKKFNLKTTTDPLKIFENVYFLGEIPRNSDFESKVTSFVFEDGSPDFVMDDSAIAINLKEGLFVITGCGHAGIVNTLEHAKSVTGDNKIYGIMGGFHLKENDRQTQETIRYLKDNKVKHVLPSHCTALPALVAFYDSFKIKQVKTGDVYSF